MPQKRKNSSSAAKETKRSKTDTKVDLTLSDDKSARPWVDVLLNADTVLARVEKLELMLQKANADRDHLKKITDVVKMKVDLFNKTTPTICSLQKELSDKDKQVKTLKDSIKELERNHSQTVSEYEGSKLKLQKQITVLNSPTLIHSLKRTQSCKP